MIDEGDVAAAIASLDELPLDSLENLFQTPKALEAFLRSQLPIPLEASEVTPDSQMASELASASAQGEATMVELFQMLSADQVQAIRLSIREIDPGDRSGSGESAPVDRTGRTARPS